MRISEQTMSKIGTILFIIGVIGILIGIILEAAKIGSPVLVWSSGPGTLLAFLGVFLRIGTIENRLTGMEDRFERRFEGIENDIKEILRRLPLP